MRFSFLIFLFIIFQAPAQNLQINGTVQDTLEKTPLKNVLAVAIRIKDSTIIDFTRTDYTGKFKLQNLPIDTYQVVLIHSRFGDQSYFIVGSEKNMEFDFGKIILPPKDYKLKEIVVFAFKDPVYYRGDTLIYTADSFKVKPNATVEDLLKKLPGISVASDGKIKAQGKDVDKVLVDGDEFFGDDPTIATKNLNATAVESVQVYEKKNEDAQGDDAKETLKVLDLKLKEDAKKGYFGKMSASGDFQKYYESEILLNRFNKKQKVSVFGMINNTPRSSFDFQDIFKYGLNDEMNFNETEDGGFMYIPKNSNSGIPRTIKTGFYFNDKLSEKTKINTNYSYNNSQLASNTQTQSQTFLSDTSFINQNLSNNKNLSQSHKLKLLIEHKLDSMTTIEFAPKVNYSTSETFSSETTLFISEDTILSRSTEISNTNKGVNYSINPSLSLKRKFKKEDRKLSVKYNFDYSNADADGFLKTTEYILNGPSNSLTNYDQKKNNLSQTRSHKSNIEYIEPLSKKIKLEFTYDFSNTNNAVDRKTFDAFNGEYITPNSTFSNDFRSIRTENKLGTKFTYEVKKQRLSFGVKARNILVENENFVTSKIINQSVSNLLPFLRYRYKLNDNSSISFDYITKSTIPTVNQLQPVTDNSNPNSVVLGNPNLLPTFRQEFSIDFHSYKVLTGQNIYGTIDFSTTNNDISTSSLIDSLGRNVSMPVNVNGNFNIDAYAWLNFSFLSKLIEISPTLNAGYDNTINYINNTKNTTINQNYGGNLGINLNLEKITIETNADYSYTIPQASLSTLSTKPYSKYSFNGKISIELPKKFKIGTDASYTINTQRSKDYNINLLLINGSVTKTFLKKDNLEVSLNAFDILNQNINVNRTIQGNVITDSKTNIIARYFLVKAIFKFNSNKTKENDEEF